MILKYLEQNLFNNPKRQILLVIVVTALVFINSLSNRLVWDDHLFLENWSAITSINNIDEILKGSAPPSQDKIYRPIRGLIWLADYQLFGQNPTLYHLQALLIHLSVTLLIYFITAKIMSKITGGNSLMPFLVALFFGIHPIHTETIDYISSSVETFGSLFFFASFYCYLYFSSLPKKAKNYRREISFSAAVLFSFLAFFTYEMTLTLPVLIVGYELIIANTKLNLKSWGNRLYLLGTILGAAVVYLFIRIILLDITSRTEYLAYSFYFTMLTMVQVFVRYILLLFIPINLTAIHNLVGEFPSSMIPYDKLDPLTSQTIFDTPILLSILTIGVLIAFAIRFRSKHPIISFGILWFFISLLPVSYIIPHGGAMAEKYLYIASFGFLLCVFSGGYLLLKSKIKNLELILLVGVTVLALIFSGLTFNRNKVWKDDISLFTDVLHKSPNNLMANYTLGIWYTKYNYFDQAEKYYQTAILNAPEFWEARYNLGNIYLRSQKYNEATDQFNQIINNYPEHTPAKNILANMDLFKESTPSATENGDLLINYEKNPNFNFSFPNNWKIVNDSERYTLKDPDDYFSLELSGEKLPLSMIDTEATAEAYLKTMKESTESGELINQGLARIPNVEQSYVYVYNLKDKTNLHFYLFSGQTVVKVTAYPLDPSFSQWLDMILGSIKIKD